MPLYLYKCPTCAHELETITTFTAPAPTCKQDHDEVQMVKQITATSFQLKGPGWARDGYSTTSRRTK
jgi:putative FmdB family regulatory protein